MGAVSMFLISEPPLLIRKIRCTCFLKSRKTYTVPDEGVNNKDKVLHIATCHSIVTLFFSNPQRQVFESRSERKPNLPTLNSEIRLPSQLGCLTPRKLLYKPLKSTKVSSNTTICTQKGSWIPTTHVVNSKVIFSCIITINIYIVWNVKKLVTGNLISLFSVQITVDVQMWKVECDEEYAECRHCTCDSLKKII